MIDTSALSMMVETEKEMHEWKSYAQKLERKHKRLLRMYGKACANMVRLRYQKNLYFLDAATYAKDMFEMGEKVSNELHQAYLNGYQDGEKEGLLQLRQKLEHECKRANHYERRAIELAQENAKLQRRLTNSSLYETICSQCATVMRPKGCYMVCPECGCQLKKHKNF